MSSELENGDEDYIDDPEEIDPNVFHIWNPLLQPVTIQYTTEQLHTMIHEGDIDLDPEYQRAVVWSSSKQMAIIDSLFHNYYVPPVVFAITKDPIDGVETRLCVDGKQRLTSIQKFFDGQKHWWYTTSTSTRASRAEIPLYDKKTFAQKMITCIEYRNLSPTAEREVFQRVQLGVSLTNAEKLQAISSPWANYITHLEKTHVTIDGGLVDMIAFDDTRGRAFQNVAQLVYCCSGLPADQRVPTALKLDKWLTTSPGEFASGHGIVLSRMWELATNRELDAPFRRHKAKVSPVEFVFIGAAHDFLTHHSSFFLLPRTYPFFPYSSLFNLFFVCFSKPLVTEISSIWLGVLLYTMRHGFTPAEQSRAAFILRRDLRKAHVDVRFNARVAADCWRIIDAIENGEVDIEPLSSSAGLITNATSTTAARATRAIAAAPRLTRNATNGKRKSLDSQRRTAAATQRGKKRRAI
ncbi:hypothetical protein B0F90DRAFT_1777103 [Multifurca ochricompacta]|uniref:GmrSD restriction endonucleases N-terminal domain-containing protein n=1 Tax=Multifurca ochricompacta TaxID=376703 RepID=A0AAD4LXD0_9AGAM|nr:hypothetical protein B0F90DRAFT_1777103 [Multifurca ochricompacta]